MIPIRHVLVLIRGVIEPLSKTSTGPTVLIWVILSGISAEVRQNSLGISLPALELIMNIFLSILYSFRSLRFTIAFGLFGRSHLLRFESKLPILFFSVAVLQHVLGRHEIKTCCGITMRRFVAPPC